MHRRNKLLAALLMGMGLAGCTYVVKPHTEVYYDGQCDIEFKKATLTVEQQQIWFLGDCSGQACAAMLIANVAVTPVSAIVSGSIVVVGNTFYWLQKTGQCMLKDAVPST